ncbi:MAG: CCA tRNA nucleotidyltransferase, partial [bacterium]
VCLGRAPHDCDLACALTPGEIMAIFAALPACHVVPTGARYGTVTIFVQGDYDHGVEVTTFRADGDYSDGRRPDSVSFSDSIGDDLARRDFTVNALALNTATGAVIDAYRGRDDLRDKLIRCVGDPAVRFREDALRMLRAVRFAATLEFTIEAATLAAIADLAPLLANVSHERVRDELGKMLISACPAYALELLRELGTLPYLLPEMLPLIGFEQNNPNHTMDVWHHTLTVVENVPAEPIMRTTALLHDLGKPECYSVGEDDGIGHFYGHEAAGARIADAVLQRLRYPTEQRQEIVRLIANHRIDFTSDWKDAAWRRLINKLGREVVAQLITFRHADQSGKGTRTQADCAEETAALQRRLAEICAATPPESLKLALTGEDIMRAQNLPPGPRIGQILAQLQELVLVDPAVNTREELLRVLGEITR